MKKIKECISPIKAFAGGMGERALTVYASSGCYYLFMSLVPVVMILCCLLPYTPFSQELVLQYVDVYFSASLGKVIRTIVNAVYRSSGTTLTVSIVLTLYSASASMRALMKGMNAAYGFKSKENIVITNVRALLYMIFLLTAIIASLIIMVYGAEILSLIRQYLPQVTAFDTLLSGMRFVVVMVLLGIVFLLLYTWMPARRVRIWNQLPGAIFAASLWVIFSGVFSWYVNISNKYGAYGYIGTIMVVMMWMYYCLYFLLIGGYINSYLTNKKEKVVYVWD